MTPAYSAIFFTTASGAGYGLLALLAAFSAYGGLPQSRWFGLAGLLIAFAGITFGLVCAAVQLGRPDRAWRALSQWRTSWLSREGVFAVATYIPGALFAFGWIVLEDYAGAWRLFAMVTALFSVFTVYCTGMIYASLPPVLAWCNRWTVRVYLGLALWTGSLWLNLLAHAFGAHTPMIGSVVMLAGFIAFLMKRRYWRFIDTTRAPATPETATGLTDMGRVRLIDGPATQATYVEREMGYRIARAHATRLRRIAFLALFLFPWAVVLATMESTPWVAIPGALAALASATVGVLIERWLFFAEARHTAMLYFGAEEA